MAAGLSMSDAVELVAGFAPRLKWPNDLVWPGDGSTDDRKLAGILAEADWPPGSNPSAGWAEPSLDERVVVAVGIGVNVNWSEPPSEELAGIAVSTNAIAGHVVDREELLIAFLQRFDDRYDRLVATRDSAPLLGDWRQRSATLGRRVRVDLGADDVEGTAVDITSDGHLVVECGPGDRRVLAAGDVVHLRRID